MSITQKYNKRQKRHTYLVSPNLWKFIRISAAKRQRISWKLHKDSNPMIFTVKRTFSCYFCRFFRIVQGSLTYIVQLLSLDKIRVDPCLEISRHNVYFWNKVFFSICLLLRSENTPIIGRFLDFFLFRRDNIYRSLEIKLMEIINKPSYNDKWNLCRRF